MKNFEQIPSDGHKMSLAEGGVEYQVCAAHCIMGNGHMDLPHPSRITDTTESIAFPQLC